MRRVAVPAAGLLGAAALALLLQYVGFQVDVAPSEASAKEREFWSELAQGIAPGRPDSFADLAQHLSPAVVNLRAERTSARQRPDIFEEFFGPGRPRRRSRPEATGSGFVISQDGYIVTNNHVVEGADRIVIGFDSGDELQADVVGRDPKTDLALLKVEPEKPLQTAPLGDSDELRVGDWVMAIGNPFGLEHTVTVGILSARGRRGITGESYDNFLQTDASINPGNSGGPLIDMSGRVVGINTAINAAGQGIGFAIPINMAKELLPQLRAHGSVTRGWLGVSIQEVKPNLAEAVGLETAEGALVSQVFSDSPADRAGLKRRDVIVEFDGEEIRNYNDLPRRVAVTPPGTEVDVIVIRDGKRKKLSAVLDRMDQPEIQPASAPASRSSDWGFEARELNAELREHLSLSDDASGVAIVDIDPESPAAESLRPGDVILEVNKIEIEDLDDLAEGLDKNDEKALLLVQRGEATIYMTLEPH
jgi:serine protease Do